MRVKQKFCAGYVQKGTRFRTNMYMKTSILLGTMKRLSLLILLTGLLTAVSAGPAMAAPPMPVTCGSAITTPGEYVLAGDCTGINGIVIVSSDVHLKLNGHTMSGIGFGSTGISAFNVSHVHIEGPGTITSWQDGILFGTVTDSHVEQVTCVNNQDNGLFLGQRTTDTHVNNNLFSMNLVGLRGQSNTSDNHLDNNQAINNRSRGISLDNGATNYHVNGNTALGNLQQFDLFDGNASCDDNKWNGNNFATANQTCIH
jgi:hypothetical protein